MRLWLGVTDNDWFRFLSRADVDEVNFWQPSRRAPFVGLEPGAPFLFKLKRPYNHIAGGGIADIAILLTYLAHDLSIDLQSVVSEKITVNERKYPLEKSYRSNKKYTDL